MEKNLYFSVIIPTLNEEKCLPTILTSIRNQTFKDFELYVCDGGSKDKTKQVFEKYTTGLPNFFYILSTKKSVGYQRNLGAKHARGEYLIFLDADVDVSPTFLEELHISTIKRKFSMATTWILPDSKKAIDNLMILFGNLLSELAKEVNRQFSGGYNTIIKRDIFWKLNGFREDLKINEDHDLAIRAFKKGIECVILKEPRVVYSLRRFRSEGTIKLLRKYTYGQIYNLLKGPITRELFDYQMGGDAHMLRKRKKPDLIRLNTYLRGIEKFEKKITELFKE